MDGKGHPTHEAAGDDAGDHGFLLRVAEGLQEDEGGQGGADADVGDDGDAHEEGHGGDGPPRPPRHARPAAAATTRTTAAAVTAAAATAAAPADFFAHAEQDVPREQDAEEAEAPFDPEHARTRQEEEREEGAHGAGDDGPFEGLVHQQRRVLWKNEGR